METEKEMIPWLFGHQIRECMDVRGNISQACVELISSINEFEIELFRARNSSDILLMDNVTAFGRHSAILAVETDTADVYARETGKCKKKAVIMEEYKTQAFIEYSKLRKRVYIVGNEAIVTYNRAVFIHASAAGTTLAQTLVERIKLLMGSGIYQLWSKWYKRKAFPQWEGVELFRLLRNVGQGATNIYPLSMNTNILLPFYMSFVVYLFSFAVLLLEKFVHSTLKNLQFFQQFFNKLNLF